MLLGWGRLAGPLRGECVESSESLANTGVGPAAAPSALVAAASSVAPLETNEAPTCLPEDLFPCSDLYRNLAAA